MSDLPISNIINVSVDLSPLAAQAQSTQTAIVLGSTNVIDTDERIRSYPSITAVAEDFSTSDPEYLAARRFFGQVPQPKQLYIGRWAETATHGLLRGGALTASEQTLSNWTAITNGGLILTVDGTTKTLTSLDFSAQTNLNGVAAVIDAALTGATVAWDSASGKFTITSGTTGTSSIVGYATGGGGTALGPLLKITSATASAKISGIAAEDPADVVALFDNRFGQRWFALGFKNGLSDADHQAVAEYIAASQRHVYGFTTSNTDAYDSTVTNDIGSILQDADNRYTFGVFSSSDPYAHMSVIGKMSTVNFEGVGTANTMMFKQLPGVAAESLTNTQAGVLKDKNYNVFATYSNDTDILQYGRMFGEAYIDEIYGLAWLRFRLESDGYNLLYTSKTKVPQTDAGNHLLENVYEAVCQQGVRNGLMAPGVWNSDGFGELQSGDTLHKGYYIYRPPVAQQSQADRDARKSVIFQIAVKMAGAIHSSDVLVSVNR